MSSEGGVVLRMRRDFPGDIKEKHGDKYLDQALWDDHLARGRAILSQFADDIEESENMIEVLICDHEKACQCLTALNNENKVMPYSNDFLEETIEKINHPDLDLDHPKVTSL